MRNLGLQMRLAIVILVVTIPILAAVSSWVSYNADQQLDRKADEQLAQANLALKSTVSIWLNLNIETLQQLASLPDIVSMDPSRQKPVLVATSRAHPHLFLIMTTDVNGKNIARNDDEQLLDYSDRIWFMGAKMGAPVTIQALVSRTSGKPAVNMATPIKDANGKIIGVASIVSEIDTITDQIQTNKMGATGLAYVVENSNRVVAHPDSAVTQELKDFSAVPAVDALRRGTEGKIIFADEQGVQWRAYVSKLNTGWGVVVQQKQSELAEPLRQFWLWSTVAIAAGAVLTLFLVSLAVRRGLRPIQTLTDTATAIAAGDLNRTAEVTSRDQIGTLAAAFNHMTAQLRELVSSLEQRVAERTAELAQRGEELEKLNLDLKATGEQAQRRAAQLAASSQVARAVSQIRELDHLLPEVTRLISDAFGVYHVGIFIVDESNRFAVLSAANSEGGQRMLARGHKLAVGTQGIVGYVTGTGQPRVALDTGSDAVHFDNPDLPQTHSEIALPLRVRDQVFGALDVQSTQEEAFTEDDAAVLSTLADQIAIAIDNAQLFARTRAALQTAEQAQRQSVQQEWEKLLPGLEKPQYEYHLRGVAPVGDTILPEMQQAVEQGTAVVATQASAGAALAVPIKLRDQVIGVIDLQETDAPRAWTEEEMALVTAVADQAAQALENARLFQQTQLRARRDELVTQIATKVHAAPDADTILRTAVQELRRVLRTRQGIIRLVPEKQLKAENAQQIEH